MQHGLWLRNMGGLSPADLVERAVDAPDTGCDGVFVSDSLMFEEYPESRSACEAHGVSWLLSTVDPAEVESIRAGPPV